MGGRAAASTRPTGRCSGIIRRSRPELASPDLFVFGLPARFTGYYPGYSAALAQQSDVFTWAILKAHTVNRAGSVLLRSADPRDTPDIRFRYFEEGDDAAGEDLDAVVTGIEVARSIMRGLGDDVDRRAGARGRRDLPRAAAVVRPGQRRGATTPRARARSAAPPTRAPSLGSDFRVHGTRGLRVVDASVFPRIPGFFIVTAIYMVAEKASAADRRTPRPPPSAGGPPSLDLRQVLARLPRPRKPARPTAVQENR